MGQVRVILREDVHRLGEAGEVVTVKAGYARNFLLPRGMANAATESSIKELEHQRRVIDSRLAKEQKSWKAVRSKLHGRTIEFEAQVGEGGKLFGSVTNANIAERIAELGVDLDRRKVGLREPIKEVGEHPLEVKLHRDVTADIKIVVKAVGGPPPPVEGFDPDADEEDVVFGGAEQDVIEGGDDDD